MGKELTSGFPPSRGVGRYRIYAELAAGGMATVHLGCLVGPAGFSKVVAIKSLHREFASEPEFVSMFLDEARLASSIHHPNVVPSLDVVVEEGALLVVMDYVHGETLGGLLRLAKRQKLALPIPIAVSLVCDALEGLHAAHTATRAGRSLNIVHRDVSPQNIIVGADGHARILDFGIAKAALRSRQTAAGIVKGKAAYMAPEQIRGREVDARTDVFATGVVLWEALTDQRLFWAPDNRTTLARVLKAPIAPPSTCNPSLTSALDRIVLKALARDPAQRFQTAQEFADALRRASPASSRGEIAKWVTRVGEDVLAMRLELLHALESSATHPQLAAYVDDESAMLRAEPTRPESPSLEPTQAQAATATTVDPPLPPSAWQRLTPWAAAAAGLLIAYAAVIGAKHLRVSAPAHYHPSVAAAQAQPTPPVPVVPPRTPSVLAAEPLLPPVEAPPPSPLPPLESPASTPSKPESKLAKAAPSRVSHRAAAAAAPSAVEAAPTNVAVPAPSLCSPPYRVDAAGVRRVKPECL